MFSSETNVQGLATVIAAVGAVIGSGVAIYKARGEAKAGAGSVANTQTENALNAQGETIKNLRAEVDRKDVQIAALEEEVRELRSDLTKALNSISALTLKVYHLENRSGGQ
jgi:chromosome segregation ATPase